ncbi:MAG: hypothetical protein ACREXT_14890, partial [Gammaproteobacteria bacterium]
GVTIPVPAKRLKKRYEYGKALPEPEPGNIIELSLAGLSARAIFAVLKPYRDHALRRAQKTKRWPGVVRFVLKMLAGKMTHENRRAIKEETGSDPIAVQRSKVRAREAARASARKRGEKLPPTLKEPELVQMGTPVLWDAFEMDTDLWEFIGETLRSGAVRIIAARIYPPGA